MASGQAQAEALGEEWGTAEQEAEYYRIVEIPVPDPLFVEAGCFRHDAGRTYRGRH